MYFPGRKLLRERPRQHELGLVDRPGPGDHAIERRRHPPDDRVYDPALDIGDRTAGIALVPLPIEVFGRQAELDDEFAREVLQPDLAAVFLPQTDQGLFVLPHDDPGVGAADEVTATDWGFFPGLAQHRVLHCDAYGRKLESPADLPQSTRRRHRLPGAPDVRDPLPCPHI
jgi:hypothetical protein